MCWSVEMTKSQAWDVGSHENLWVQLKPMSDTQQSWATLSFNFVAWESCL